MVRLKEAGKEGERGIERNSVRNEILILATVQCRTSVQSKFWCFMKVSDKREKNSTLAPESAFLIVLTLEFYPFQSFSSHGKFGLNPFFVSLIFTNVMMF